MLRKMTLEGISPSSRIRIVPENDAPHISCGLRFDYITVGHIEGTEGPTSERWITDSSGNSALYRYAETNLLWTRPDIAFGFALDAYLLRWMAPFVDAQFTILNGKPLYTIAGGLGFLFREDKFSFRLDGSLKLSKLNYDVLFVDEYGIGPDISRAGSEHAKGFAIQSTFNTMKDILFLRYYLGSGYELLNYSDDVEGELVQTSLQQAYVAVGAFRLIGPITASAGLKLVMMNSSIENMDPQRYLEPNFQLMGDIKLPRLRKSKS
jgi:hypothetical protein